MNTQYREIPLERFFADPELPTRQIVGEEREALYELCKGESWASNRNSQKKATFINPNRFKEEVGKLDKPISFVASRIGCSASRLQEKARCEVDFKMTETMIERMCRLFKIAKEDIVVSEKEYFEMALQYYK